MAAETEVIDALVDHIQESYELAMDGEDIPDDTRERIHDTVGDAVGNNYELLGRELGQLEY